MNNIPKEFFNQSDLPNKQEVRGISKALDNYKKDVLRLQDLPMTADCLIESIEVERLFRKSFTKEIRDLVELNCANCPLGFTNDNCEAKQCPFKSIKEILDTHLKWLKQNLPGYTDD